MTSRQDVDAVVQSLQRLHASLPGPQQRIMEYCLDRAQQGGYTPGGTSEPDVTGYQAQQQGKQGQQGYTQQQWTKFGQYLQSATDQY
jgi:hypothetical protein